MWWMALVGLAWLSLAIMLISYFTILVYFKHPSFKNFSKRGEMAYEKLDLECGMGKKCHNLPILSLLMRTLHHEQAESWGHTGARCLTWLLLSIEHLNPHTHTDYSRRTPRDDSPQEARGEDDVPGGGDIRGVLAAHTAAQHLPGQLSQ